MFKEKRLVFITAKAKAWNAAVAKANTGNSANTVVPTESQIAVERNKINTKVTPKKESSTKTPPVKETPVKTTGAVLYSATNPFTGQPMPTNPNVAARITQRANDLRRQISTEWADAGKKYTREDVEAEIAVRGKNPPQTYAELTTPENVDSFLNDSQDNLLDLFTTSEDPATRDSGIEDVMSRVQDMLNPDKAPERLDSVEKYEDLRQDYGVGDLETKLADMDKAIADLDLQTEERINLEGGRAVPMGVIEGRQTEVQKQQSIARQKLVNDRNYVAEQLNTKYNIVGQMMQFAQYDYTTAVNEYNTKFSQNLQVIGMVQGIVEDAKQDEQNKQNAARANFQLYIGALEGTGWDELTADQQTSINKLAVQSGIPSSLAKAMFVAKDMSEAISTTSREGSDGYKYIDIVSKDKKTGEISVESVKVGKLKGSSGGSGTSSASASIYGASTKKTLSPIGKTGNTTVDNILGIVGILTGKSGTEAGLSRAEQVFAIDPDEYADVWNPKSAIAKKVDSIPESQWDTYISGLMKTEGIAASENATNTLRERDIQAAINVFQAKINDGESYSLSDVQKELAATGKSDIAYDVYAKLKQE